MYRVSWKKSPKVKYKTDDDSTGLFFPDYNYTLLKSANSAISSHKLNIICWYSCNRE